MMSLAIRGGVERNTRFAFALPQLQSSVNTGHSEGGLVPLWEMNGIVHILSLAVSTPSQSPASSTVRDSFTGMRVGVGASV